VAALCALSSIAEARVRTPAVSPECNITMPCIGVDKPAQIRTGIFHGGIGRASLEQAAAAGA